MNNFKAIAIIRLSALGDIIHAFPVANILRRHYPASRISWIVDARYQQILEGYEDINEIIPVNAQGWKKGTKKARPLLSDYKNLFNTFSIRRFSLSLDLQGLIKSGFFSLMTRAEKKVGFKRTHCRESLNAFFNNIYVVPQKTDVHIIDKNLRFLKELGINTEGWKWQIPVKSHHEEKTREFLSHLRTRESSSLVGINPGAGWETKRWGSERYALLADCLIEHQGATVIWTWGPGEEALVGKIQQQMKAKSYIAPPTGVLELAALIRQLDLFVGGDTGPLHLAVALGIPTVSIFGPTDPKRNGPYGPGHRILYNELECSGCHKRICNNFHCLDSINPDIVFNACQQQLQC